MGLQEAARADEDADAAWSANADRGHFPPRLRIPSWWRRTTISSSRSPPPRARARTTPRRSRWSTISTTRTLNRFGGDREHGRPGRTRISLPHMRWTREHSARSAQAIGSTALHPPEGAVMRGCAQHSSHGGSVVVHQKATATHSKSDSDAPRARAWSPCRIDLTAGALAEPVSVGVGPRLRRGMERGSSPPKLGWAEALSFFSAEEVARARSYHRPLYWAGVADVVIEASVLATLVWSGLIRERRWGFSTQHLPSWLVDRAKAVGVNIVLTAVALLGLVGLARAQPGWWVAPAAAAFALATILL